MRIGTETTPWLFVFIHSVIFITLQAAHHNGRIQTIMFLSLNPVIAFLELVALKFIPMGNEETK